MKRYSTTHYNSYYPQHESLRHEIHDERKSEEQKLDRLKKLLQTKVESAESRTPTFRAA